MHDASLAISVSGIAALKAFYGAVSPHRGKVVVPLMECAYSSSYLMHVRGWVHARIHESNIVSSSCFTLRWHGDERIKALNDDLRS